MGVGALSEGRACTIVRVPVRDWNDSLTPWKAPCPRRGGAPFGGSAAATFLDMRETIVPLVEAQMGAHRPARRAICGYSLGGLFALFAFTVRSHLFCLCLPVRIAVVSGMGGLSARGSVRRRRSLRLFLAGQEGAQSGRARHADRARRHECLRRDLARSQLRASMFPWGRATTCSTIASALTRVLPRWKRTCCRGASP